MPWFAMYIAAKSKPHCFGCDLQLCYMSSQIGVDFMRWMMEHGHFWNQHQVIFVLSFKARKSIRLPMKVCHNMHCRTSPCQRDSINFYQFLRTFLPEKGSTDVQPSPMSLRWYYYDCISSGSIGPQFQDYYDVIFEGYASAMPSPQELRSRVTWHGLVTSLARGRERLGYSDFLLMNMEPV